MCRFGSFDQTKEIGVTVGTASDVSFLIDFLPTYLFPSSEREVYEWMVSGISLGGHSTWIVLRDGRKLFSLASYTH